MATQYSITLVNNSTQSGTFMVFQKDPGAYPNVMSLAWMAKNAHPATQLSFDWTQDYNFVWDETGMLVPGVTVEASQVLPADPTGSNSIKLIHDGFGFSFEDPGTESQPGSLLIQEDATIPPNTAAVGIGMSGAATFMVQAQPNMNVVFTPHPEYWVAFGNFEQGEVLDVEEMTNAMQINFPPNTYHAKATLNADNTWTAN